MRTSEQLLHRSDDATTSGGATTTTLFDRLFDDNKKALKDANRQLLQEDIKMTLTASVHNANKATNRLQAELNTLRADLENIDFEAILEVKDQIRDNQAQIDSAKEEYLLFFGTAM